VAIAEPKCGAVVTLKLEQLSGGAVTAGWHAFNISSDTNSGIGNRKREGKERSVLCASYSVLRTGNESTVV